MTESRKDMPLTPKNSPPSHLNWRSLLWMLVLWLVIGLVFFPRHDPNTLEIPYSTFKQHVTQGRVAAITIKGETITGTFKEPVQPAQQEKVRAYTHFSPEGKACWKPCGKSAIGEQCWTV